MIKIAFITINSDWPWKRQLPLGNSIFNGVEFFVPVEGANIIFVFNGLPTTKISLQPHQLIVFIASEPEFLKKYNTKFLDQFDAVITSDRGTSHPLSLFTNSCAPWHVGSMAAGGILLDNPMTFDDFELYQPGKTKLLSVVTSDKAFTVGHRARLAFVARLKEELGDQVDVFGRGLVDFPDKLDVLEKYRYHIAIENCAVRDYWTEKLADSYLTLTFPIYFGCPNINEYFPELSLEKINIFESDLAFEIIRNLISSDVAEQRRDHLLEARRRVMHEHNIFALMARIAKDILKADFATKQCQARLVYAEDNFLPIVSRTKQWFLRRFR